LNVTKGFFEFLTGSAIFGRQRHMMLKMPLSKNGRTFFHSKYFNMGII
jgi:hypothetical protein